MKKYLTPVNILLAIVVVGVLVIAYNTSQPSTIFNQEIIVGE